jgi:hypothetical protein
MKSLSPLYSIIDFHRTLNKPVVLPSLNGEKPFYVPAYTKYVWFNLVVSTAHRFSYLDVIIQPSHASREDL